jgi:hypothetical protein
LVDDGPWHCVGQQAPTEPAGTGTATVRVRACDAFGDCSQPLRGLSAELCSRVDVGCTDPLSSDILDSDGVLEFEAPIGGRGFDGYLAVASPGELCTSESFGEASDELCALNPACNPEAPDENCRVPTHARALFFFNPPIVSDTEEPLPLTLVSTAAQPALARATSGSYDPTRGSLVISAFDCNGEPASGLHYDVRGPGEGASAWYIANGIPSAGVSETDASGSGGFTGLPPGFVDLQALTSDGQRVGGVGVQVSARSISYVSLLPSP